MADQKTDKQKQLKGLQERLTMETGMTIRRLSKKELEEYLKRTQADYQGMYKK